MPVSLEERVAYLEGKIEEHSRTWADLKDMMIHLESRINALDQKVDRFREELSSRIDALDQRLSGRIDSLDQKLLGRIDALDQKLSRYFLWVIGVQVTLFLAIIGVLLKV